MIRLVLTRVVVRRDGRAWCHVLDEDGARAAVLRERLFEVEAPLVESSFGRHLETLFDLFFFPGGCMRWTSCRDGGYSYVPRRVSTLAQRHFIYLTTPALDSDSATHMGTKVP